MTDLSDKEMLSRIARALKANSARFAAQTPGKLAAASKKKTAKRPAAKTAARKRKSA